MSRRNDPDERERKRLHILEVAAGEFARLGFDGASFPWWAASSQGRRWGCCGAEIFWRPMNRWQERQPHRRRARQAAPRQRTAGSGRQRPDSEERGERRRRRCPRLAEPVLSIGFLASAFGGR